MSELRERLERAVRLLEGHLEAASFPLEEARLKGKIEGVKLALSYLREEESEEPWLPLDEQIRNGG